MSWLSLGDVRRYLDLDGGNWKIALGVLDAVEAALDPAKSKRVESGRELSRQHAINSARVASAINPTMLSALTLMLHRGTPLRAEAEQGLFQPLSPYEFVLELKELVNSLDMHVPCIFRSNHVSNMLPLAGTLPDDKNSLLRQAEDALQLLKNQTRPTFNDDGPF